MQPVRINAVSVVDYSIESGDYRDARYAYIYGDDECPEDVDESYGADSRHIPGDEDYRTDGDDHGDDHYGSDDGYGLDDYLSPNDVDQHTGTDDGHLGADDEFDLDYYEQYLSEDDLVSGLDFKERDLWNVSDVNRSASIRPKTTRMEWRSIRR